jgi:cytochrome c biogenesis protein CcmG/thiol:disulfide interchange protein DsbE
VSAIRRLGLVIVLAMIMMAGCTAGDPVTRSTVPPATPTAPAGSTPQPADDPGELASQKAATGIAECTTPEQAAPVDGGLPDLTLDCLGGGQQVRLSDLRGTPMVINVWAQWCGPCRTEAPFLAEVSRQSGHRVEFLGIDFIDPFPGRAIAFADEAGWRFPQLVDPDGAIQVPMRLQAPPQSVFVRADGTVAYTHIGPITSAEQLRELIATHLGVTL